MRKTAIFMMVLVFGLSGYAIAGSDHYGGVKTLRPNSMFDDNVKPPKLSYKGDAAGSNELLPRGYDGAPPQIPHDIADLSVELGSNDCMGCHLPENADKDTPATPATHLVGKKLNMGRFNCTQCHVPQANTKPLVKNENDVFIVKTKKR